MKNWYYKKKEELKNKFFKLKMQYMWIYNFYKIANLILLNIIFRIKSFEILNMKIYYKKFKSI